MATRTLRSTATGAKRGKALLEHESTSSKAPPQKRSKTSGQAKATGSVKHNHEKKSESDHDAKDSKNLHIIEETGDIFDAPENTLLIHACNCHGHWGAGIAKAFKDRYPHAYEVYNEYCDEHDNDLCGTAQLISPYDESVDVQQSATAKHFVGCLFTSRSMGRKKDSPTQILKATKPAMVDLLEKVKQWNANCKEGEKVTEVRMCKINSGLFAVPWEKTKAVLEEIDVSDTAVEFVKVVSLPG